MILSGLQMLSTKKYWSRGTKQQKWSSTASYGLINVETLIKVNY